MRATRQALQWQRVVTCLHVLIKEKANTGIVPGNGSLGSGYEVLFWLCKSRGLWIDDPMSRSYPDILRIRASKNKTVGQTENSESDLRTGLSEKAKKLLTATFLFVTSTRQCESDSRRRQQQHDDALSVLRLQSYQIKNSSVQHLRAKVFVCRATTAFYVEVCRRMLRAAALLARGGGQKSWNKFNKAPQTQCSADFTKQNQKNNNNNIGYLNRTFHRTYSMSSNDLMSPRLQSEKQTDMAKLNGHGETAENGGIRQILTL